MKDPLIFKKSNSVITSLRSFGKVLFDLEKVTIAKPYNDSNTHYKQQDTAQISIYKKKQTASSANWPNKAKNKSAFLGAPLPSKRKTIAACVAKRY